MSDYDHKEIKVRDARGGEGMVSSGSGYASEAGARVLRDGGNAVDAAAAVSLALSVTATPYSGIGGGGFMLVHMAERGESLMLDYRENSPAGAPADLFNLDADGEVTGDENHMGVKAPAVPGTFAGMAMALEKFGTMTLAQVAKHAVAYGRDGFAVTPFLGWVLSNDVDMAETKFARSEEASEIWLKSDGSRYETGETFHNTLMANTIEAVASKGVGEFYEGFVAKSAGKYMAANGGVMRASDFAAYRPILRTTIQGTFKGLRYVTSAPPSSGGIAMQQLYRMLEPYDLAATGHNTVETIDTMCKAYKQVYAARDLIADPDYEPIDNNKLTSDSFLAGLRNNAGLIPASKGGDGSQTSHFSAVDSKGNAVASTESLEAFFGSGVVIPGTGVFLNNTMGDFDPVPGRLNSIVGGKRPRSAMSPIIFLRDGKPVLVVGSAAGPRIITVVSQVVLNVLVHGMDIQSAIEAPRFHYDGGELHIEGRIGPDVRAGLEAKGYKIAVADDITFEFGGVHAITVGPEGTHGGADPRRDGVAKAQ
jgi:gamma-glutamyltranspeptidase / glutathione hydrolase